MKSQDSAEPQAQLCSVSPGTWWPRWSKARAR